MGERLSAGRGLRGEGGLGTQLDGGQELQLVDYDYGRRCRGRGLRLRDMHMHDLRAIAPPMPRLGSQTDLPHPTHEPPPLPLPLLPREIQVQIQILDARRNERIRRRPPNRRARRAVPEVSRPNPNNPKPKPSAGLPQIRTAYPRQRAYNNLRQFLQGHNPH